MKKLEGKVAVVTGGTSGIVKGVLFTVQKALPPLVDGGSIVLTASTTSSKGTPAFSVYSATKPAVRSFARTWTLDIKQRSIRVNALSPGATETAGLHGLTQTEAQGEELKAALVSGIELFVDGGMAQI